MIRLRMIAGPNGSGKITLTKFLQQSSDAIKLSDRAYLFDNSGTEHKLVAEITDGKDMRFNPSFIPNWFDKYVLRKLK